jgi:hypothetical protein
MYAHSASSISTRAPDRTDFQPLGAIAPVSGLAWADTYPGGPDSATCAVQAESAVQPRSLEPGRIVEITRGGSVQFEGILSQPAYVQGTGWQVGAKGAGTYGDGYRDIYTTWNANDGVNQAIARSPGPLRWVNPGIPSGLFLAQQQDSASQTITDFLTLITKAAGYGWHVGRNNVLSVAPVPVTPTRILMATSPQARALAGYINALVARYQVTADNTTTGAAATYGLVIATNPPSIAKHQRMEAYWDISQAGVLSSGIALGYAASALSQYQAASWAGPIPVQYGQYLTMTGVPVDLGCEKAGEVALLMLADGPYGGEVTAAPPVSFVVGKLEYDDTTQAGGITPYLGVPGDLSSLLDALATTLPVPAAAS